MIGIYIFGSLGLLWSAMGIWAYFYSRTQQLQFSQLLTYIFFVILYVFLLLRRGWARILLLFANIVFFIGLILLPWYYKPPQATGLLRVIIIWISIFYLAAFIFYFTRPKVKRQFTGATVGSTERSECTES
jgi:energy-coupling factor transporter transmembrane protein EcfT